MRNYNYSSAKGFRTLLLFFMIICISFGMFGCKSDKNEDKKLKDLDFTVIEDADLPGELKEIIDEKKEEPFRLTYSNKDSLYIVEGYGKQNSGGYSITVDELYLTEKAIYINTNLLGPTQGDFVSQGVTYPYVVVKLEYMDKKVEFK